MNLVILSGRLGHNPDKISNGIKFKLATKEYNGTEEVTIWNRVLVFGSQAELVLKYCKTGSKVLVQGRLNNIKDEETGNIRTSIIASRVEFLEKSNTLNKDSLDTDLLDDLLDEST